jgi:2,3-bisphosphoglycerate-independent phosphoglycerate mutase
MHADARPLQRAPCSDRCSACTSTVYEIRFSRGGWHGGLSRARPRAIRPRCKPPICRTSVASRRRARSPWYRPWCPSLPPGSDVANLSLLGYNPSLNYTGRAPIEAAGAGIPLAPDEVAFRCNLVTVRDGIMQDYSAGHISTEEAHELMAAIEAKLGRPGLKFHGGVSYRHLLVWQNGPADAVTTPPHEFSDKPVALHLPQGAGHVEIMELIEASKDILAPSGERSPSPRGEESGHPNLAVGPGPRVDPGLLPGKIRAHRHHRVRGGPGARAGRPGRPGSAAHSGRHRLPRHQLRGQGGGRAEIAGGASLRLRPPGSARRMRAPGRSRTRRKLGIELFDARIVAPIWQALEKRGEPYRLIVAMDHRTPVSLKGHSREPVPIVVLDGPWAR